MPIKRKKKVLLVPMDGELYDETRDYARSHGSTAVAITRAMWRWLIGKGDNQELPPGIESEEEAKERRHKYRHDVE